MVHSYSSQTQQADSCRYRPWPAHHETHPTRAIAGQSVCTTRVVRGSRTGEREERFRPGSVHMVRLMPPRFVDPRHLPSPLWSL